MFIWGVSLKNVRIKDIARLSGVSAGTVDRVLHQRGRVSEDALKKVMAVLDQIEYRPNLLARTLASNKTIRLAALVPDPDLDPYWALCWAGIRQAQLDWAYYGITIESFPFNLYDKNSFVAEGQRAFEARPEGILVAPIFHVESLPFLELFRSAEIPFVFFNTNIPEFAPLSFIGQDLYQSGRVAAELMWLGTPSRERHLFVVMHIAEDIHNAVHLTEKEKGFRDFMTEVGNSRISTINVSHGTSPSLDAQLREIISDPELSGVFVSTSKATYLVASALEKQKNSSVRLGGYDLLEETVPFVRSGTVGYLINQNPKRQAQLGISHLVNHIIFRKEPPDKDLFPLEIITRQNVESYLLSGIH